MTQSNNAKRTISAAVIASLALAGVLLATMPTFANAATYAYVDATGEVKSITANDWMTAIAVAPNIHIHSGVLLLKTASDYQIIGDEVGGAN